MTRRVKVVSEPTDLVPVLRSFDTAVKREVFRRVTEDWVPRSEIEEDLGEDGLAALEFFDKSNLVETKWVPGDDGAEKAYHTYYTGFNIQANGPVDEVAEVLGAAVMSQAEFDEIEEDILAIVAHEGKQRSQDIAEKLEMPMVRLRSLVKRSAHLEFKGHHVHKRT